jgi:hypothetical protein
MSINRREYLKSLFLAPLSGSIISSSGKLGAASNINWNRGDEESNEILLKKWAEEEKEINEELL